MTNVTTGYCATGGSVPVWRQWVTSNTSTARTTGTTWTAWCDTTTATTDTVTWAWTVWQAPVEEKKQNRAQRRLAQRQEAERQAEQRRLAQEAAAKAKAAQEKAEATLLAHLSPEQEQAWKENRAIFVTGKSGKRYKLDANGRAYEVDAQGKHLTSYCIHPDGEWRLPRADVILAKKLALEWHEAYFLRTANATRVC